jgi:hypothetical protein
LLVVGCGQQSTAHSPVSVAASGLPVEAPPDADPTPAEVHDERPSDPQETWLAPLPALELATLTEAQQAQLRACLNAHPIEDPRTGPADVLAAAQCLAEIPAPGPEIRLYRELVNRFPGAQESMTALRLTGQRLEQIDERAAAIDNYMAYLRRHPKEDDARALGQRACCLALSRGDEARTNAILHELDKLYRRKGFSRPTPEELVRLCSPTPAP